MQHRIYAPVGHCIYCLAEHPPLDAEHIVPFGLNGELILPQSSCRECGKITGKFEQICLRKMFGPIRTHLNLKTRRPKERPKTLSTRLFRDGEYEDADVPIEDHPFGLMALPAFPKPGILIGQPPREGGDVSLIIWNVLEVLGTSGHQKKLNAETVSQQHFVDLEAVTRMIAKIAHSYAAAERPGDFRPLLPGIILGTDRHIPYLVGGAEENYWDGKSLHSLTLHERKLDQATALTVTVELFAALHSPVTYEAVVGLL